MSTDNTNTDEKLNELKEYATEIGVSFRDNIGIARLEEKIHDKEVEISEKQKKDKLKAKKEPRKKVKIVVEPRERDHGVNDQFFGYSSMKTGIREDILIQFGEEVEVSETMYNYIKSITYITKKFKMVPDQDGIPQKQWYDKKYSRFIVSKV